MYTKQMSLKEFIKNQKAILNKELQQDFEFLILESLNISKLELHTGQYELSSDQHEKLIQDLNKLIIGEPLAYILNSQNFLNYSFYVDHRVLIPRPETEFMVDYVLRNTSVEHQKILDAGAGSGCIGISYLLQRQSATCVFIEKSELAIEVLKKNLELHNIQKNRYSIFQSFDEYEKSHLCKLGSLDLFLSNPPYIANDDPRIGSSVLKHEPSLALYAEDEGLFYLKSWSEKALKYLNPNHGVAIFEFGLGQENFLQSYANMYKMNSVIIEDQYSVPRFWKIVK
jgi:release factor glutamine methyltransferase